MMSTICVTA